MRGINYEGNLYLKYETYETRLVREFGMKWNKEEKFTPLEGEVNKFK